jgi:uncharacterized protein (DUF4415 family)
MKKNYDLKKLKWKSNPYLKLLKKPVTIRFDQDVIDYFVNRPPAPNSQLTKF